MKYYLTTKLEISQTVNLLQNLIKLTPEIVSQTYWGHTMSNERICVTVILMMKNLNP